jgi:hypothetical protein
MNSTPCLVLSIVLSPAALALGQAPEARGGRAPARGAEPLEVTIDFAERRLAESDRTPQGELKAILSATATLKTKRSLRYRSAILPPGTYPVTVVADGEPSGGHNLFFVIGPVPGSGEEKKTGSPSEKKQEEGDVRRSAGGPTGSPEKKGRGDRPAKMTPGQIRALFHLTTSAKGSEGVEFKVQSSGRGDRCSLTVRAGGSQGKATLRFVDA